MPRIQFTLVLLLCTACAPPPELERVTGSPALAIEHVNVVDVESGRVLLDQTVVIEGSRLTTVGSTQTTPIPTGIRTVDGRGKYLIPGLWDAHVHPFREGRAPHYLPALLAHGVTGVRDPSTPLDSAVWWHAEAEAGRLPLRAVVSAPPIDGPPGSWYYVLLVETPGEARALVDSIAVLGLDEVMVFPLLGHESYFAAAEQAALHGLPLTGALPHGLGFAEAAEAGQRTMEYVVGLYERCVPEVTSLYAAWDSAAAEFGAESEAANRIVQRYQARMVEPVDTTRCRRMVRPLAEHDPGLVLMLGVQHGRIANEEEFADRLRFVPPERVEGWRAARRERSTGEMDYQRRVVENFSRFAELLHEEGVMLLAGTDASVDEYVFPGSSLHDELALHVAAGLSPLEALRTATINPARHFGLADSLGTVEVGKLADLVLLEANPLADIRNTRRIRAVVANGVYHDRQTLDALLEEAAREAAVAPCCRGAR